MVTGLAIQQLRNETLENIRIKLMTANAHAIAGDYDSSAIAFLLVKSSIVVLKVLDDEGWDGECAKGVIV
jgi:hypothetical protein